MEIESERKEVSHSEMTTQEASIHFNVKMSPVETDAMDQTQFKEDLTAFWNNIFSTVYSKMPKHSSIEEEENTMESESEKGDLELKQDRRAILGDHIPTLNQESKFMEEITQNIEDLFLIFIYFVQKGGYYQVFAKLKPEKTKQRMIQIGIRNRELVSDIYFTYKKYLFHYERFHALEEPDKWSKINEVLEINPNYLRMPEIRKEAPSEEGKDSFIKEVLAYHSVVLSGFEKVYGVDDKLFDVDMIRKNHGKQVIDVMYQNPRSFGFDTQNKRLRQHKESTTLEKYVAYQHNMHQEKRNVMFAVNIDTDSWKEELGEYKKLPPEFTFMSNKDALSLVKRDILGVNVPQVYLKVEGVWTGGHEENLRMRAININHGPKGSYWYTMSPDEVPRFRTLVQQVYGVDIHKSEGLWFADLDFILRNKLYIEYFIQHKGDIVDRSCVINISNSFPKVLLGPGCLHWVRAKGLAVNSAWNFGTACRYQFEAAFRRFEINKEIDFYQKTIIPLHNLVWELLRKKKPSFNDETRELFINKLSAYLSRENEALLKIHDLPMGGILKSDENDDVIRCSFCDEEILNYFLYLPRNSTEDYMYFSCMSCFEAEKISSHSLSTDDILYYKEEPQKFVDELKAFANEFEEPAFREKISFQDLADQCRKISSIFHQHIEKCNADSSLKNSKEKSQHLSEQYAENEEEIIRSKKFGAKSLKTDAKRSRLVSKTRSSSMMFRDYKNLQESASKGGKGFRNSPLENTEQNLFELFNSQIGEDLEIKIKKKVKTSDANEKAIDCNSENRTQLSESEKLFPENPLPPTLRDILESKSLPTAQNQSTASFPIRRFKHPGFSFLKPLESKSIN